MTEESKMTIAQSIIDKYEAEARSPWCLYELINDHYHEVYWNGTADIYNFKDGSIIELGHINYQVK